LRIGFRPTVVTAVAGEGAARVRIVLGSAAVSLAAVKVSTDDQCRIRSDSGRRLADTWEMARTALATAGAGETGRRVIATGLVYRSWRDEAGTGQLWQTFDVNDALTSRRFVSAPPEQLARDGYAVTDPAGGDVTFLGPDTDALIADEFAAGHCFRLVPTDAAHGDAVGVAFRPARTRGRIVDIAGTFWLDRVSGELRLLEFRYTNVPPDLERMGAGGRVEYRRLASGDWLVNRWHIRLPTVVEHDTVTRARPGPGRLPMIQTRDEGALWIVVSGGELLSALSNGVELYHGTAPEWRAQAIGRAEDIGWRDVTVEVPGSGYFAAADSGGALGLDHVRPGTYDALVSSGAMRTMRLPPQRRRITVADARVRTDTLALPTDDELLRARCGKDAIARGHAVAFGVATGAAGDTLRSEPLYVRWMANADIVKGGHIERSAAQLVRTDALGRWTVCGLPRLATLLLTRTEDSFTPENSITVSIARDARLVEVRTPFSGRQ
jgi:hypothetical protein